MGRKNNPELTKLFALFFSYYSLHFTVSCRTFSDTIDFYHKLGISLVLN